ncbi:MAG: hypothetical protein C0598_07755 [Marinilabiliales bacterium]|nr:MAG: hypothetical protein C0598_07755 [Marinilabiliales bacterium]
MKKNYIFKLILILFTVLAIGVKAQTTYTNQLIIVNGGVFSDPDDFVTVSSFNPETQTISEVATIYTQSVQDVIIIDNFAYVAAQDSIVKINIDTYEKVASVSAIGINQLASDGNILLASFWYPVTENFVRIFSLDDLTLQANISEISGDAADFLIHDGIALVAVPGAYGSTSGKVASIDIAEGVLLSEDDYGEFYSGIGFFGFHNDVVTTFMTTAWGETTTNIGTFDDGGNIIEQFTIEDASLAKTAGQHQQIMYLELNNGISEYNLISNSENAIIDALDESIASSVVDTINNLFYITTTDYFSFGSGYIYNFDGTQTGTFEAGISAQAIAIDYRTVTSTIENIITDISVFPNPSSDFISIKTNGYETFNHIEVIDNTGRKVLTVSNSNKLDIRALNNGLYFLIAKSNEKVFSSRFIKN